MRDSESNVRMYSCVEGIGILFWLAEQMNSTTDLRVVKDLAFWGILKEILRNLRNGN